MNKDQKILDFAVETGLYVNIPFAVMDYLHTIRADISTTALQLYIYYHFVWRTNSYETRLSSQALATALASTPSSIKRANAQLIAAGLIVREERSLSTGQGISMKLSSITRPAVPDALAEKLQVAPLRRPFHHPRTGEIGSFCEFLELIDQENNESPLELEAETLCEKIAGRICDLAKADELSAEDKPTASKLAREITWSIFFGQLGQSPNFQSDAHRVNAALNLLKRGEWKRPRGFPDDYLLPRTSTAPEAPDDGVNF